MKLRLLCLLAIAVVLFCAAAALAQGNPDAQAAKGIGDVLATGGGYGLSGLLVLAIAWYVRENKSLGERVLGIVEKQVALQTEITLNMRRQNDLIEKALNKRES